MNAALRDIVEERLTGGGGPAAAVADLVLAACADDDALTNALDGRAAKTAMQQEAVAARAGGVYLSAIEVKAFRGIGPHVRLELPAGPGLTLVVGRNGSGKSSFAEGLELLLTGANRRWEGKSQVWTESWRNIHSDGPTEVAAELVLQGRAAPLRVSRRWEPGAALSDGALSVSAGLELGWEAPLSAFRPFLSYSELGSMFDEGPSRLYDALSAILGLDDLTAAQKALQEARLGRERALRAAREALAPILVRLQDSDDERAMRCREILAGKEWDLGALEQILKGVTTAADPEAALGLLEQLASLAPPDPQVTDDAATRLERALAQIERLAATDAGRALQLAGLLEQALSFHEGHEDDECPVCRTPGALGEGWASRPRPRSPVFAPGRRRPRRRRRRRVRRSATPVRFWPCRPRRSVARTRSGSARTRSLRPGPRGRRPPRTPLPLPRICTPGRSHSAKWRTRCARPPARSAPAARTRGAPFRASWTLALPPRPRRSKARLRSRT